LNAVSELSPTHDPTGHHASWRRLSFAAGGLPEWLPRTALADTFSRELLVVAAESANASSGHGGSAALLSRLLDAGFFQRADSDAVPFDGGLCLRPEVRRAMLAELDRDERGVALIREEMLRAGLRQPESGLGVQLAVWADEAGDWASLEQIWILHRSGGLVPDARSRAIYASVPSDRRAERPGLSYAAALASAYDASAGRVDLDQMTTALIRDGRTLHVRWMDHATAEAKVLAGTMWMMARATIEDAEQDQSSGGPAGTAMQLGRLVQEASLAGGRLSARALTFYHSTASLLALVVATSSSASGNTQYFLMGDAFLARHASHDCEVAGWIEPGFHLAWADAATRRLDREEAERQLRLHEIEGANSQWFNNQPVHALIRSTAASIWHNPQHALAEFDSIVSDSSVGADLSTAWGRVLLRSRAELLLRIGAVARAERIVEDLLANATDAVSAVPAARLLLAVGDFQEAVAKADEGIFTLQLSLADRAHLYALKAAALHLSGAPADQVSHAAAAACVVCEQAATLLPFAMLPELARLTLIAGHDRHHESVECFVSRARRRGAFEGLQAGGQTRSAAIKLTRREEVLLPLLATSATVQEIADQQFVSVNTVRKQVVSLREKVGSSSRSELIRRARELGLLPTPGRRHNDTP